jgi:hypothetical protein
MGYSVSLTGVMVILANVLSLINFLFCLVSFIAEGRAVCPTNRRLRVTHLMYPA